MLRWFRPLLSGLLAAALLAPLPAAAARQIVDFHKLDAYFALFARDSNVPWKPTTVRLDTYSNAPVAFAVYQVDPADVLTAGANTRPRAIDTRRYKPLATWNFTPPGGYQFQSNEVPVPLGHREGFFVVEARRGDVGEQVWINRTRVGLLVKETPGGILLYGTDLGTGRPFDHMRVLFVVNSRFVTRYTDAHGVIRWSGRPAPVFALAQWGDGSAFVSFLPQAPLPATIVGVKLDSAVVHAGDEVHVVGFARSRDGALLRPSRGTARVVILQRGDPIAQSNAHLDLAGAFATTMRIPPRSRAGDYAVLATVDGATAGTTLHVDADAGGLSLEVASRCRFACDPNDDVPLVVRALREGRAAPDVTVRVGVIRSPHVFIGTQPGATPWGTTKWYETSVRTGSDGAAFVAIPHPTDGLASTYGVRVESGGATAVTRVVVPTAPVALRLVLDRDRMSLGTPLGFDVSADSVATGKPVGHLAVRVQLLHGASIAEQIVTLDGRGYARGSFSSPQLGSNLAIASTIVDGATAMDAQQVQIVPQAMQDPQQTDSGDVRIELNEKRYVANEEIRVTAVARGAQGDALLTYESAEGSQAHVVPVRDGRAYATFRAVDAPGALQIGAAFVRGGGLVWSSTPLHVDAAGRPIAAPLLLNEGSYAPGALATLRLADLKPGLGTLVVRLTRGEPSGSALFETAPDLLAIGSTTSQDTAPPVPSWHPWVDSTGQHAQVMTFARRSAPPQDLTLAEAATQSVYWRVERHDGDRIELRVPRAPGTYLVSILEIDDDGRVVAGSSKLVVR